MSDFGSSTGKQREYLNNIESVGNTTDSISDEGKNVWQHSIAYIQSFDGPVYTVNIERENTQVHAFLGMTQSYWGRNGVPSTGDKVIIRHKKDFFKATIESVLEKDSSYDISLFNFNAKDNKYEGRYRDCQVAQNEDAWNSAWNTLTGIYFKMIAPTNSITKRV